MGSSGHGRRSVSELLQIVDKAAATLSTGDENSKRRSRGVGSPAVSQRVCDGVCAQHELALRFAFNGDDAQADEMLRALGFRYKLSPAIMSPLKARGLAHKKSKSALRGEPILLDGVLPESLVLALTHAFRSDSAFWRAHDYPTPAFFSYLSPLDREPCTLIEQVAAALLPTVREVLGADAPSFEAVEWWAHTRAPHEGHQLHYDLDEARLAACGEVNHPLVSSVLYIGCKEDEQLSCTLVTTQRPSFAAGKTDEYAPNAIGYLARPHHNRLLLFEGIRLHGVVPSPVFEAARKGTLSRG